MDPLTLNPSPPPLDKLEVALSWSKGQGGEGNVGGYIFSNKISWASLVFVS